MTNLTLSKSWNERAIRFQQRGDRLWVSLTDMAQASGKSVEDYLRLDSTIEYLQELQICEEKCLERYAYTLGLDDFTEAFSIFAKIADAKQAREKQANTQGIIYIISNGLGHYKIGFSENIKKRVKSLQTSNSKTLTLVKTFSGDLDTEKRLHKLLKEYNTTGEWYKKNVVEIVNQELINSLAGNNQKNNINSCFPFVFDSKVGGIGIPEDERGTWAIEEVAIEFASWCNIKFKIWVNCQIKELMTTGKVELAPKPKTALELAREHLELAREQVKLLETIEAQSQRIEALEDDNEHLGEMVDELFEFSSIIRVAVFNNMDEGRFNWRELKRASLKKGLPIKRVPCQRFKYKLLYHHDAWAIAYPGVALPTLTDTV